MIRPVTGRDITDVAEVQAFIGGELAARAAAVISDAALADLATVQADLEAAYTAGDGERAVRLNHDFHRAINVAADSPKLAQLMSQITRYAPEAVFPTVEGWPENSNRHHRRVLAALAAHDQARARAAMAEHLTAGAAPMIDHLTRRGVLD